MRSALLRLLKPVPTIDSKSGGKESWAVLDTREGDALLALTKYTIGVETLLERLEASECSSAYMAVVNATPQQARADARPVAEFQRPRGSVVISRLVCPGFPRGAHLRRPLWERLGPGQG